MTEDGRVDTSETTIRMLTFILLFVPFLIKNLFLFDSYVPRIPETMNWILSHPESYHDWITDALLSVFTVSIMMFGVFAITTFLIIPWVFIRRYHLETADSLTSEAKIAIERAARESGLKKPPKIYILNNESSNSFVFGRWRDDARLALTSGLIKNLTPAEIEGVATHEMSHVLNNDIWIVSWAQLIFDSLKYWFVLFATLGFAVVYVRESLQLSVTPSFFEVDVALFLQTVPLYLVFLVILPWIVLSSAGRTRELLADARASIFGNKDNVIQALTKISSIKGKTQIGKNLKLPRFLSIVPSRMVSSSRNVIARYLFDSHPSEDTRIEALCEDRSVLSGRNVRLPSLTTAVYIGIVSFYVGIILGNVYGALIGIRHTSSADSMLTFGALEDLGFVTTVSPIIAVLLNVWTWRHSISPHLGFTSMLTRVLLSMFAVDFLFNLVFLIPKTTLLVIYEERGFFELALLVVAFIVASLYVDKWVKRIIEILRNRRQGVNRPESSF
jgi:heat shock protein HtpX